MESHASFTMQRSLHAPGCALKNPGSTPPQRRRAPAQADRRSCSTSQSYPASTSSATSAAPQAQQARPSSAFVPHATTLQALPVADTALRLFDTIDDALGAIAAGEFVVVLDNEDRENEGDLIMSGDKVTPQHMAFMVEHTTGIICAAMRGQDLDRLDLPLMVPTRENEEALSTAFTITVDARHTTTTGVSATDRCNTLQTLADPSSTAHSLRRPGHIFPLRCREGGVAYRPGHTEAAVQLVEMAGCIGPPVGVLSEIVDRRDGSMARTPHLIEFAKHHGLRIITIADLVQYLGARTFVPSNGAHASGASQHALNCASLNGKSQML